MKIWVILCLAAGPLAVRAQLMGGVAPPPVSGGWGDSVSFGWRAPGVGLPSPGRLRLAAGWEAWPVFPNNLHWWRDDDGLMTLHKRDSLRMLLPDRMPCLTSAGADPMLMDRRKGRDPMPNGSRR